MRLHVATAIYLTATLALMSLSLPCIGCDHSMGQSVHDCCPETGFQQKKPGQRDPQINAACGCPALTGPTHSVAEGPRMVLGHKLTGEFVRQAPRQNSVGTPTQVVATGRTGGRLYLTHRSLLI